MEGSQEVKELDDGNYDDFVGSNPIAVVDFWGPNCAGCRMVSPVIDQLSEEMKGQVAFGKMDVTRNLKHTMALSIMSIPTILFYRNGSRVKEKVGFLPKGRFMMEIRELL